MSHCDEPFGTQGLLLTTYGRRVVLALWDQSTTRRALNILCSNVFLCIVDAETENVSPPYKRKHYSTEIKEVLVGMFNTPYDVNSLQRQGAVINYPLCEEMVNSEARYLLYIHVQSDFHQEFVPSLK